MKKLLLLSLLLWQQAANTQKVKQDLSKSLSDPTRKEILEALKNKLQPQLRLKPKLLVTGLWVKNDFAFYGGEVRDGNGKLIDFRKTAFKEEVAEGFFDGPATNALLKKTGGKWKVLAVVVGPTDVPWGCWWKEFKAPKEIFNYAENDCSWVDKK